MLRDERRSRQEIGEIQARSFRRLVRHAYEHVPFYRDLYSANGIDIESIRSLTDIKRLPIISKDQLRAAAACGELWGETGDFRIIQTSGSSGHPFKFYVNHRDNNWRKAQALFPYVSTGRKPWQPVLRLSATEPLHTPSTQRLGVFREKWVPADATAADHYEALAEFRPPYLQGYPSVLRLLALYIVANRLAVPTLAKVYTDSELLDQHTRKLLMRAFKTDVIDVFGSYETDNIAYECSAHRGYHLVEDSVIVETTSADDPESVGQAGQLVCTVLHNTVTPFIRYNLGDVAEISTEPCGCGRTSRMLMVLRGRTNDLISLADGSKINAQVLITLCNDFFLETVKEFQIHQIDFSRFDICIVSEQSDEAIDVEGFYKAFTASLPDAKVAIRRVETIERAASGKFKAFVGLDPTTAALGNNES